MTRTRPGGVTVENTLLTPDHTAFLTETFARNKSLYGDWFMELEGEGDETPAEGDNGTEDPESGTEEGDGKPDEGEPTGDEEKPAEDDKSELTLDAAKSELKKARHDAAGYRQRLREAEAKLENAKTPEAVEELLNELKSNHAAEVRELLTKTVALEANLPGELADSLKGDTREELEAHAKLLAKFVVQQGADSSEDDLTGGLDPTASGDGAFTQEDAIKAARAARARRY